MDHKPVLLRMTSTDYRDIVERFGETSRFLSLLKNMACNYGKKENSLSEMLLDAEAKFCVCLLPNPKLYEVNAYVMRRDLGEPDFKSMLDAQIPLAEITIDCETTVPPPEAESNSESESEDLGPSQFGLQLESAEVISQNWYSTAYLATYVDEDGERAYCFVKSIKKPCLDIARLVIGLQNMARICTAIEHKNIIQAYAHTQGPGFAAILTELIDGCDLGSLLVNLNLQGERLPLPLALAIAAETAAGLHHLHTAVDPESGRPFEAVHGAVIPGNILLDVSGRVLVTDLSMVKSALCEPVVAENVLYGYYAYMSPEAVQYQTVDARSDVFSLGVVLWEMLAMRKLFTADCGMKLIEKVANVTIDVDIRSICADMDEELWEIIKKALAQDPAERYASALEFGQALRGYLERHYQGSGTGHLQDYVHRFEGRAYKPERLLSTCYRVG